MAHLSSILRRGKTLLEVNYALMLAYRAELLLWAVAMALPLIMMGVWVQAGATGAFPMDDVDMARYFIAVFVIRQFSVVWVIYEFEWHVVTGRLSPLLLHPMDPIWRWVAAHLSEQFARLPFCVLLVVLCFVLFPSALWGTPENPQPWLPAWWQVLLAVLACYAAFFLRFLMQYCLSILSFWVERVGSLERLWFLPYLFLSGLIAPIDVFWEPMRTIALWTPFPYLAWFPAKLLVDGEAPIVAGFAIIAGWLVAFWLLYRWLWRQGLKHYSAMGA